MIDKDEGIIVFSKKIKDNDLFIKILSSNDKIISGIVYGGNSSKKKMIYQTGYFIEFTVFQKNKNTAPTFKAELKKPSTERLLSNPEEDAKQRSYKLEGTISD